MDQFKEPCLAGRIDLRAAGPRCKMLLGDLNGDGRMEIVMVQPDNRQDVRYIPHQTQCLTAFDLEGRLLWQFGTPDPGAGSQGSDYPAQIADIDGDGQLEVLCVMHGSLLALHGSTGQVKRSRELPDPQAHDCLIVANLAGGEYAGDLILKDRYRTLWALDREWNLLWKHEGNPGHYPWVYDFDGDGRDEVMAGYDLLDHDGRLLWSCQGLDDHADCIWVGDVNGDGKPEIVVGGSVTVMYDAKGHELWRYEGSVESQHIALGRFRPELPGLQIAGLDRLVREDDGKGLAGKDALFLLDNEGRELWKEDRATAGWLTIAETLGGWEADAPDYILAYRRGGGVPPTLYDGQMGIVTQFPLNGYAVHADLCGSGTEQVIVYTDETAEIYASRPLDLRAKRPGAPLQQPKRLSHSTLYPGGEQIEKALTAQFGR
ncbi:FG-GAP-like repeat-containing protein [Cohnella lubricantis]|uniref:VCBS repeat-containing protein n=1 Tax=Cohnella lubricantis TaxID=2163172 RepID=A0A841TBT5_9BACL|nr:FG-GAP-like repeat-containing protein [Cohnella lubricantis]MBB6678472.1 VCBS repeat-containing protein [Cohnella lubricantis]MBP2118395.1 outer membrane protein assembly factor BamB [Cohnella lubricantis]